MKHGFKAIKLIRVVWGDVRHGEIVSLLGFWIVIECWNLVSWNFLEVANWIKGGPSFGLLLGREMNTWYIFLTLCDSLMENRC